MAGDDPIQIYDPQNMGNASIDRGWRHSTLVRKWKSKDFRWGCWWVASRPAWLIRSSQERALNSPFTGGANHDHGGRPLPSPFRPHHQEGTTTDPHLSSWPARSAHSDIINPPKPRTMYDHPQSPPSYMLRNGLHVAGDRFGNSRIFA